MNIRIKDRLEKLEYRAEELHDLSGRRAVTEAQRVVLRKLSTMPDAVEIIREHTELRLKGVALDAPEMLEFGTQLDEVWRKHFGEEDESPFAQYRSPAENI